MPKKQPIQVEGKIFETLPNTMFRVELDSGYKILAHLSGKMRMRYIRKTIIELTQYKPFSPARISWAGGFLFCAMPFCYLVAVVVSKWFVET